jgi:hypothetical protein
VQGVLKELFAEQLHLLNDKAHSSETANKRQARNNANRFQIDNLSIKQDSFNQKLETLAANRTVLKTKNGGK